MGLCSIKAPSTASSRTDFARKRPSASARAEVSARRAGASRWPVISLFMESAMLNKVALANSSAALGGAVCAVRHRGPGVAAPLSDSVRRPVLRRQRRVLFPKVAPSAASVLTFVVMIGMSWVVGYAWAWLYNRFAKAV